ncbi:hypothetical protein B0T22DRAFT_297624 [Podospora appendiculata]|uniref:NACHT domain-containing protein n=1 Tax=Podospora appendiculata TaxID=314037 RepID=A0AAE0X1Q3_9PEZI|nr:hypothetical protein B0T22DRAFT_297624 [Podospora appendiculata]
MTLMQCICCLPRKRPSPTTSEKTTIKPPTALPDGLPKTPTIQPQNASGPPALSLVIPKPQPSESSYRTAPSRTLEMMEPSSPHSPRSPQPDPMFVTREVWTAAYDALKSDPEHEALVSNYEVFFDTLLWPTGMHHTHVPTAQHAHVDEEHELGADATPEQHFRKVAQIYLETTQAHAENEGIVSSAVHFMQRVKDVVSTALAVSPQASLAWAGVCLVILPIILNHAEQIAAKQTGFSYVMSRFTWYDQVMDLLNYNYWKSQHNFTMLRQSIKEEIIQLYKLLIEYQLRAYFAYCRPLATLAKDILKLDDWEGMVAGIKASEGRLQDYMEINFKQNFLDRLHTISEDALRKQRQEVILKFKFPDELPYDVYQAYLDSIETPQSGTGYGVLSHPEFVKWASGNAGAFVLSGMPGTGKSVLAKAMLTELPRLRNTTVCAFFFKDNGSGQNLATTALCRVLDELFKARVALVDDIIPKVEHLLAEEVRYNFDLLWSILDESTQGFEPGAFTIVLDALDECESESATKLCDKLSSYLSRPFPRLKFFLTTRPLVSSHPPFDFRNGFILETNDDSFCLDHLSKDIESVLTYRFEHFACNCIRDEQLKQELFSLVQPHEERSYLYVKLLFDFLELKCRDGLPRIPRNWIDIFKTLPATVKAAYHGFLERVRTSHQNDVRLMLQMVVAAARPLTVRELNIALNIRDCRDGNPNGLGLQDEDAFGDWILDACRYFVDVYHGRVYFIHQTAKDYLLDDASTKPDWIGEFTLVCCHRTLAESCIAYLSLPFVTKAQFKATAKARHSHASEDASYHLWDLGDLEFGNYAAANWHNHLRDGQILLHTEGPGNFSTHTYIDQLKRLHAWDQKLVTCVRLDFPPTTKLDLDKLNRALAPDVRASTLAPWMHHEVCGAPQHAEVLIVTVDAKNRFTVLDEQHTPVSRIARTPVEATKAAVLLAGSLRAIATFRAIEALTNYRPHCPLPMDWFSIRIFNKTKPPEDGSFGRLRLHNGENFSYVIANRTDAVPVYVHMLCLNASWTIGTLLWNTFIPPRGETSGDLAISIPRKVNELDADEIEDTILVIFCVGEQLGD